MADNGVSGRKLQTRHGVRRERHRGKPCVAVLGETSPTTAGLYQQTSDYDGHPCWQHPSLTCWIVFLWGSWNIITNLLDPDEGPAWEGSSVDPGDPSGEYSPFHGAEGTAYAILQPG